MIRRHPHVFGDTEIPDAAAQTRAWEAHKAAERAADRDGRDAPAPTLSGVARALPALIRAEKLAKRAARVGFDWPSLDEVIAKIREELAETEAEITAGSPHDRLEDEVGDLLFAVANLARKLDVDPEAALRRTNDKFTTRFAHIEARLNERDKTPEDASLEEMDQLWNEAKSERGSG
jgi:MazG family protein